LIVGGAELLMLMFCCQGDADDATHWSSENVCHSTSVSIATCWWQWPRCWHLHQARCHGIDSLYMCLSLCLSVCLS